MNNRRKWIWWSGVGAFVLVAVFVVLQSIHYASNRSADNQASEGGGGNAASNNLVADIRQCQAGFSHTFGSTRGEPINPGGRCAVDLKLPEGVCIYQQALNDPTIYGPLGNCPGSIGNHGPNDVVYTWSAGAPFDGYVMLSSPRYY